MRGPEYPRLVFKRAHDCVADPLAAMLRQTEHVRDVGGGTWKEDQLPLGNNAGAASSKKL